MGWWFQEERTELTALSAVLPPSSLPFSCPFLIHSVNRSTSLLFSCSVCLTFLQPHGLQPTSLLCPWDSPGKHTGVGCHFFSRGSSPPTDRTLVSSLGDDSLPLTHLGSPPRHHNQALIGEVRHSRAWATAGEEPLVYLPDLFPVSCSLCYHQNLKYYASIIP